MNETVIERFYTALGRHDGEAMAACYAPDVHLVEHAADGDRGTARWIARYTFSQTGHRVRNDIRASFRFADGLIVEHRDEFDFHRWARQALGTAGLEPPGFGHDRRR